MNWGYWSIRVTVRHTPKVNRLRTDEALKLLADKGGVLGFVGQPRPVAGTDRCDVSDYAKPIKKSINLMGENALQLIEEVVR
jgi:microsomal dipeptidase-like Zn-dependent dipeptidase